MTVPDTKLSFLGRDRFDEIVDALSAAFHEYPVMRYILKDAGRDYEAQLHALVAWFTDKRVARGRPVLAATRGGRILAAANVDPPKSVPAPPALLERFRHLEAQLGEAAMERFHDFEAACAPLEHPEPHHYVGMLGVRPEYQGQGLGSALLKTVQDQAAQDPVSTGVGLTTEAPDNLAFYERLDYRVVGRANAEELDTWTLFRPNDA